LGEEPQSPAIGWSGDDGVIADLRAWLVGRGFVVLSDHYDPDSFGNQEVTLARPAAIRLVKDRDQWRVDVAGGDGHWTWVGRWRDAVGSKGPQVLSASDQAELLRDLLDEIQRHPSPPDL
jgi:hypothetical protein